MGSETPRLSDRTVIRDLRRFMPRLVAAALLVAGLEVIVGTVLAEPALVVSAVLSAGFGALILVAGVAPDRA